MSYKEAMKQSIEEYIGVYTVPETSLEAALYSIVSKYSPNIYMEGQKLLSVLQEAGVPENMAYQICLMTTVTGFKELLENDERTQQADLDRFVSNAKKTTGFNRPTIMELTRAIAKSLEIAVDLSGVDFTTRKNDKIAYTIPKSMYEAELRSAAVDFERVRQGNMAVDEFDISKLEPLVEAGIPKAKYYMGALCRLCEVDGTQSKYGVILLKQAAEDGDAEAAAELGDYYFEQEKRVSWSTAYQYYTELGALALNNRQKEAVTTILNFKKYNKKILFLSVLVLLAMVFSVVVAPGAGIFASYRILGWGCMILNVEVLSVSVMHYQKNPYDSVFHVPVLMFAVWFLYIAGRLLF